MQIDTVTDLRGNVYHVEINIGKLTLREQELVSQYGGPIVETGGVISTTVTRPGSSAVAVSFTLPSAPRRIPSDFPVKYAVSLDDDSDADLKAAAYKTVIEQRITTAKTALLTKNPTFVGETRTTI